jgi:hypothetical protein
MPQTPNHNSNRYYAWKRGGGFSHSVIMACNVAQHTCNAVTHRGITVAPEFGASS